MNDKSIESSSLPKKDSLLLRSELQSWWLLKVMKPLEDFCVKKNISPNAITLFGLFISLVCFFLFSGGKFLSAGWLVLVNGSIDALDGRVARATNRVTSGGAFLDSVVDRYQDFLLMAGLVIFFRDSWVLLVVLLALGGTMFTPYTKAKAETLQVNLDKVGIMQRPERIFLLGFGSILSSMFQISLMPFYGKGNHPPQHLFILVLVVLAISTNLTAFRRLRHTLKELEDK